MPRKPVEGAPRERPPAPDVAAVEAALAARWIGDPRASLRANDRIKAAELAGFLAEVDRALPRDAGRAVLVDAAAGLGYVGVLAAALLRPARPPRVVLVERDPARLSRAREAARQGGLDAHLELHARDVGDPAAWPEAPALVCALHACGDATDRVIERAVAAHARRVLVAPCCVASALPAAARARAAADAQGLPRHGEVLRRFVEAWVLGERTLALEAAGYRTEVVAFTAPTVTPYHLALRALRVGEPTRTNEAADRLARMQRLG